MALLDNSFDKSPFAEPSVKAGAVVHSSSILLLVAMSSTLFLLVKGMWKDFSQWDFLRKRETTLTLRRKKRKRERGGERGHCNSSFLALTGGLPKNPWNPWGAGKFRHFCEFSSTIQQPEGISENLRKKSLPTSLKLWLNAKVVCISGEKKISEKNRNNPEDWIWISEGQ